MQTNSLNQEDSILEVDGDANSYQNTQQFSNTINQTMQHQP